MKDIEKQTREVFDKLHLTQGNEQAVFDRLTSLLSTDYLQVAPDFFADKDCLDAGIGSNGNTTYKMLEMGAKHVTAFDLDDSVFQAEKWLAPFKGRYTLETGSVLEIKYPDNRFDFVHCTGVIHHTTDPHKAVQELLRVLKPGGTLYVSTYGKGGIMKDFNDVLRTRYQTDPLFKDWIDGLNAERFKEIFNWLAPDVPASFFDDDLASTIKDRITAPLYHQIAETELRSWLVGCTDIVRLTRKPTLHNIRKYLAPLYENYQHPLARMLYGDGIIQLKARKL